MKNFYRNLLVLILVSAFFAPALTSEIAAQKTQTATAKQKSAPKTSQKSAPKSAPSKAPAKSANAAKPKVVQQKQLIVSATAARIRKEDNLQAETMQYAELGTVFNVTEENRDWSKIEISKDNYGWISNTITENFSTPNRIKSYNSIADKYLAKKNLDFLTAAEVFYFLQKAGAETGNAELELKKYKMLDTALRLMPFEKREENPYKNFTTKNDAEIVYSEPSGEWYVKATTLWELHAKNKNKPIGEQIAWQAAQTTLPGECEGYINCYIYNMRITDGEYLNFYPSGKHSREALLNITNFLEPINQDSERKSVYTGPSDISDRAEFNKSLAELRTIVSKTPYVEKQKTIAQINRIANAFK